MFLKRRLNRVECAVRSCLPLDGGNLRPFGLKRQHGAGFHRLAVHMDNTGSALAGVAAHMGAGEPC